MRALLALTALLVVSSAHADEVDDLVKAEMAKSKSPAVAIAVLKDGKLIRSQAYGLANVELNVPATTDTVFRVASMSKQFCASAFLLLAQEGKVSVDDPISKFMPEAPESWKEMKFRHILSHTSGMPDANAEDGFTFRSAMSGDAFARLLAKKPLKWAPGSKYEYSNPGYSLLGILVGRIAGVPMEQYVSERIFKPLGMTSTYYYEDDGIVPNRAAGYIRKGNGIGNALFIRPPVMQGSGGIMSTVLDFAKWDAALRSDKPLSKAIRDQMWTRQTPAGEGSYGFGWFVAPEQQAIRHSGGTMGFTSNFIRRLDNGLTVIVLQNIASGGAVALSEAIAAHYLKTIK